MFGEGSFEQAEARDSQWYGRKRPYAVAMNNAQEESSEDNNSESSEEEETYHPWLTGVCCNKPRKFDIPYSRHNPDVTRKQVKRATSVS